MFYRSLLITRVFLPPASIDEEELVDEEEDDNMYVFRVSQPDPAIDTSRVEEIPAKEPKFHAVPLKSVLKKRGSGSGPGTPQNTPTQENRPLTLRQELHASFKLVPLPLRLAEFALHMLEYIHRCGRVREGRSGTRAVKIISTARWFRATGKEGSLAEMQFARV